MKWFTQTIGELVDLGGADIQTGPFGTQLKASDYVEKGTPVINVRNIGMGKLKQDKLEYVPDKIVQRLSVHLLKKGDIVFGRKGAVERHLFVKEEHANWMQGSDCIRLRLSTDKIDPQFVSYAFLTNAHMTWMITHSGNKATMPSLNQDIIRRIRISAPTIDIQRKIASTLSSYDDLIENNDHRIALLEKAARLLYEEWFVQLRFPGHEHTKVLDGLPEGWECRMLRDLSYLTMGQSPSSNFYNNQGDGLPFHQGVSAFGERFLTHKVYCTNFSRLAEKRDILFSVRAPVGRINITLDKIVIGRGLAAIRSNVGSQLFLYYQLKNHFFKENLIGTGVIFESVTKKELEEQKILTPSLELQRMYEDICRPFDDQIETLYLQNQKLKQARDLLLPKLMSGEVTV